MGEISFVTGGARSGKSRFAEALAARSDRLVVYIATMEPLDDELLARVARHRAERPAHWTTIEAPSDPTSALQSAPDDACVLLDCLSLWVSNRLLTLGEAPALRDLETLEAGLAREVDGLIATAHARSGPSILVSNEVGSSVVPESHLGRAYRDLLGRTNQQVAAAASSAWLLVAGRALLLPPDV